MTDITSDHERLDVYRLSQGLIGIEYEYRFAEYEHERSAETEPDAEWRQRGNTAPDASRPVRSELRDSANRAVHGPSRAAVVGPTLSM